MQTTLILLQFVIFLLLSILHFYWAFGGKWGFEEALPTDEDGKKVLNPRKIDSIVVALGLFFFAFYYLQKGGLVEVDFPHWLTTYGGWLISITFLLRAIGDFKYVGIFKRIRQTQFAKLDTRFFVPLCLVIGLIGVFLESV